MNLTLTNIRKLKSNSDNKLTKRACNYVIDKWHDYEDKSSIFKEVLRNGCESGIVGELIYYRDTLKFYKQYRSEINDLLYKAMQDCETTSPYLIFGPKWDTEDPLAMETHNQNLLAWFGFEESLRNVGLKFETLQNYL